MASLHSLPAYQKLPFSASASSKHSSSSSTPPLSYRSVKRKLSLLEKQSKPTPPSQQRDGHQQHHNEMKVDERTKITLKNTHPSNTSTTNNLPSLNDTPPPRSTRRRLHFIQSHLSFHVPSPPVLRSLSNGLNVVNYPQRGRGVCSSRPFSPGDIVCDYQGELLTQQEATWREEFYSDQREWENDQLNQNINPNVEGCFMFYFSAGKHTYCIDASRLYLEEFEGDLRALGNTWGAGRYCNHSRANKNIQPKLVKIKREHRDDNKDEKELVPVLPQLPHGMDSYVGNGSVSYKIQLVALKEIRKGEELLFDYGDRDTNNIQDFPWLKE